MKSLIAERAKRNNSKIKTAANKNKKNLTCSSKKQQPVKQVVEEKTIMKEPKTIMLDIV